MIRTFGANVQKGGKLVAVIVGVNNSASIWVTVGVNVNGVLVAVANRFCVGAGVLVGRERRRGGGIAANHLHRQDDCRALERFGVEVPEHGSLPRSAGEAGFSRSTCPAPGLPGIQAGMHHVLRSDRLRGRPQDRRGGESAASLPDGKALACIE